MKQNAILFSKVDREDNWVTGALVFKVKNTKTYEDSYNELKAKLEDPKLIAHIIDDNCLDADLFLDEEENEDKTFKFKCTSWKNHQLCYEFENSEGYVVEHNFQADHVLVI